MGGFFIDVQGTLISDKDKSLISGAKELIDFLNQKKLAYVIITNNTKKLSDVFLKELNDKGLDIKKENYIDPFCVLNEIMPPCNAIFFGADEFRNSMIKLGYKEDYNKPKAIFIASWDKFKFQDFSKMIELILKGVKLIPMHLTSIYKKNNALYPGVGSIVAMLRNATNCSYEVVGKPSELFFKKALKLINKQEKLNFSNIDIISDDLVGDLVGAKNLKMHTNLVLSGKISNTNNLDISKIDNIYEDVKDFLCKRLKT